MSKWGVVAAAALVAVGCSLPDAPPSPAVFTLFDVQELYAEGRGPDYRIAVDSSLPGGIPISQLMSDQGALKVHPAWAERYPGAYVVTEVWTDFDELWVQPAYVPVKGWNLGVRDPLTTPWQPIFGVGPGSRFYSPFWQIVFVDVPDDTTEETLTSARQVLDSGYPLYPAAGRVMVMYPGEVTLSDPMTPGLPTAVPAVVPLEGWVDGARGSYLEFRSADVRWDDQLVLDEVPIYHFVARANDGSLVQLPIPTVAGTGPPYSKTPAPFIANANQPSYAGYWRLYTVELPSAARVFAPPARPDLATDLENEAPQFPRDAEYSPDIMLADAAAVATLAGMVAVSPACFTSGLGAIANDNEPNPCRWLDSQEHIEQYVDALLIQRTNVTVTCPFVSFRGQAVVP